MRAVIPGQRLERRVSSSAAAGTARVVKAGADHVTLVGVAGGAESPGAVCGVDADVEAARGGPRTGGIATVEDGGELGNDGGPLPPGQYERCDLLRVRKEE